MALLAQKEDHQWVFHWSGVNDTIEYREWTASVLDFNHLPPKGIWNPAITIDLKECHACICDKNGKLLAISNGQTIHGPDYQPMVHGDTINYSPKWDALQVLQDGEYWKPTGFRSPQCAGLIPQPESDTIIALYQNYEHHEQAEFPTGYRELWMGKISKNQNGETEIHNKDIVLNDKLFKGGALTACRHGNGRDWWMLQFNKDTVYHYLIDPSGIHLDHLSFLPFVLMGTLGQSKFSPTGDRFALYGSYDFLSSGHMTDFMFAGFDRCSGDLIDPELHLQPGENALLDAGLEFSPDGTKVYISKLDKIFQFDLEADDIIGSRITVADYYIDSLACRWFDEPLRFGQMQIAPDNKIYVARAHQCFNISVIDFPNEKGLACNFLHDEVELPTFTNGTIPTFNTYRLGPLDGSSCDTLHIDNNPVSRFWYAQDSLDIFSFQLWDVSYFRPETWTWDLGDGNSSTERHPMHNYAAPGIYEVCLTVSNENSENTSCQTLYLGVSATQEGQSIQPDISLFPNPVHSTLRVAFHSHIPQAAELILYDLVGRPVLRESQLRQVSRVDVSGLSSGTYIYEVKEAGEVISGGKIVKVE